MDECYNFERPGWVDDRGRIDECLYCRQYLKNNALICVKGTFFTTEGWVSDENVLRKQIYDDISPYVPTNIVKRVDHILKALRLEARQEEIGDRIVDIPVANGTYTLGGEFCQWKNFCRHRLPVNYNPDAPKPERWLSFLEELLEKEDIPTLQEYMGYCLIPSNHAQKMLLITGKGGEGKSRIGVVMKALLGENMNQGSIAKVEMNPFARADLENVLVMVDDDLRLEALTQTNHLKTIITAELPMDLERKGQQSYQGKLNVRFLAFGNGNLQSLHDRSRGFFRRQIILTAREKAPDREDDPFLGLTLRKEIEGILLWCIEGLERLICNNFVFTLSPRARQNMDDAMKENNNILEFMESQGYFRFDPEGSIPSRTLYILYKEWCEDNSVNPMAAKSFWIWLRQNQQNYHIQYDVHIPIESGRYARGFRGIRGCSRLG